ncbi:organic cation transporter protein-like [Daphnia pulex]|uniref:organic cation transporter protein-like n=1 Tax=Daphnia pulex TaxID=6669 RepID=UPI001EE0E577|nr:organic cation transporter protein-like [Daphnia pulex]
METDNKSTSCAQLKDEENLEGEPFNYDDILKHLGQLGKFQLRAFLWLCLPAIFPGLITMSLTFTGGVPDYRCFVDGCDEVESQGQGDFSHPWLNNTIPGWEDDASSSDNRIKKQCYVYNHTWNNVEECLAGSDVNIDQEIQCSEWVYDDSIFGSTIVTEFELTCDDEHKQPIASTVYMAGNIFGPLIFGLIADKFGRKAAYTWGILFMGCVVTGSALSKNLITFCVLRFFSGLANLGLFEIYIVWGIESVGTKYRTICGFVYQLCFTVGSALMGCIAFFVRDWQIIQIIIGAPIFLLLALHWLVPESIRWLVATKRYESARKLILKAAKVNKKSVPDHLLVIPNGQSVVKDAEISSTALNENTKNSFVKREGLIDVLRSPVLLKRLVIMIAAWFGGVMGYYGITFSSNNLSDNFFVNYELSMLVEIPAYLCGIYVTDKVGRRPTLCAGMIISGFACLITGLVPEDPAFIRVTFSLIGKFFISTVMAVLYSFTAELFPTETRGVTVGISSTLGHFGGVVAPILADAGRKIDPAFPYIIFAIVNVCVGILGLLLPETNHLPLPTTIQEAVDMEKYTFSLHRCCHRKKEEENCD